MSSTQRRQPGNLENGTSRVRNNSVQLLGNDLSSSDVIDYEPNSPPVQHGKIHPKSYSPRDHRPFNRVENDRGDVSRAVSARATSSGGFLLSAPKSRLRPTSSSHSRGDSSRDGLISRREKSELLVSKRRGKAVQLSSIGSSPLANQVSTLENDMGEPFQRDHDIEAGSPPVRSSRDRDFRKSLSTEGSKRGDSQDGSERIGFDTDPTQIVNMALSLSEGRRRQASGIGLNGGHVRQSATVNRHGQLGSTHNRYNHRQSINPGRIFSQNSPSQNDGAGWPTMPLGSATHAALNSSNDHLSGLDESDLVIGEDFYNVSTATMIRVQKAKTHFELFYEHLRLLPHLPPLRTAMRGQQGERGEGRSYNPLQYARNRKIRFKDKTSEIDSEVWHDSQRVRAWVNAIIDDHTERRTNPDECIRLPALDNGLVEQNANNITTPNDNSPAGAKQEPEMRSGTKSSRPRSDWVVMPGDLMGDVYWLEQGSNKVKIEDRNGDKIYPPGVKLWYTGWRNRGHAHDDVEERPAAVTTPIEKDRRATVSSTAGPELPTFTSTGRHEKPRGRLRRRESKVPSSSSDESDTGSPKRGKRAKKNLIKKMKKETSSQSDDEQSSPGPLKSSRHRGRRLFDAGRNRMVEFVPKIILDDTDPGSKADRRESSGLSYTGGPQDQAESDLLRTLTKDSASSQKRSLSDQAQNPLPKSKKRPSRLSLDLDGARRHSIEYDTTAPSSPSAYQFPSIAINLSPPASRSPSPTKRVLHSRINRFREQRPFKPRHSLDAADPGDAHSFNSSRPEEHDSSAEDKTAADSSRDASPMTKTAVRTSSSISTRGDSPRNQVNLSKAPLKTPVTNDTTGRVRGFFKGGRIAQLVGTEVSRVGEYIWKRDIPSEPQASSNSSRNESLSQSETDDEVREITVAPQKPPRPIVNRTISKMQALGTQNEKRPRNEHRESYFTPNLPSFTSPFQKDRDMQAEREKAAIKVPGSYPQTTDASDHISVAAALHRTVSKSPRLDQLAPPKLTITRGSSFRPSPENRGNVDDGSGLRLNGSLHASLDLNSALAGLKSQPGIATRKVSQSGVDNSGRTWSPHTHNHNGNISLKDIARARALLLSSGAKARQIFLIANKVRRHPPHFLLSTIPSPEDAAAVQSLRVARKEEFVLFCHNLSPLLTRASTDILTSTDRFTSTTIALHTSLQRLDDLVENTLTPRVRRAADESGELGMKLATTCALATKGLDDKVGKAMRRKKRRRPVRLMRRVGYGVVEWAVVAILWAIWFVVSLVQVVIAVGRGGYRLSRWLLWVD